VWQGDHIFFKSKGTHGDGTDESPTVNSSNFDIGQQRSASVLNTGQTDMTRTYNGYADGHYTTVLTMSIGWSTVTSFLGTSVPNITPPLEYKCISKLYSIIYNLCCIIYTLSAPCLIVSSRLTVHKPTQISFRKPFS